MKVTAPKLQLLDSAEISLEKLLVEIDGGDLSWTLLRLEAFGNLGRDESMLDLESKISESDTGVTVTWKELIRLAQQIDQVINLYLVGHRTRAVRQLEANIAIELIDSAVWEIHTRDTELRARLRVMFA